MRIEKLDHTKKDIKKFVKFPAKVYTEYEHWVQPITSDVVKFIYKGPFNKVGEKLLLMAYRGNKPVARLSVHRSFKHNDFYKTNQGFFGFFEAYNDKAAVEAIFQEGFKWLKEKGCSSVWGPMNFAIYDEIGLLIDSFDKDPVIMCTYNPEYYLKLLEDVGFEKEIDWYAYYKSAGDPVPDIMKRVSKRIERHSNVVLRSAKKKNWHQEVSTVRHIFEEAWAKNWGNVPFSDEQWDFLTEELKMIVKEDLALILEVDGKPVAFSISIPDANIAIKAAKGKLFPFGLIKLLLSLRKIKTIRTVIMGVLEEYRNRGYDLHMIYKTIETGTALGYLGSDCSLILESNTRMVAGVEGIGAKRYKTYRILKCDI